MSTPNSDKIRDCLRKHPLFYWLPKEPEVEEDYGIRVTVRVLRIASLYEETDSATSSTGYVDSITRLPEIHDRLKEYFGGNVDLLWANEVPQVQETQTLTGPVQPFPPQTTTFKSTSTSDFDGVKLMNTKPRNPHLEQELQKFLGYALLLWTDQIPTIRSCGGITFVHRHLKVIQFERVNHTQTFPTHTGQRNPQGIITKGR